MPTRAESLDPWWHMSVESLRAGAGSLWYSGGPGSPPALPGLSSSTPPPDARAAVPRWCEPCTIAAAAAGRIGRALLGVVSQVPWDRHPAVLARDVTALDVVSGGRAAVVLRWVGRGQEGCGEVGRGQEGRGQEGRGQEDEEGDGDAGEPGDLSTACEHLGEAVAVCRAVLQDEDPVFEGRYLHIAGAVNRPHPVHPGGPPIVVHPPAGALGLAGSEGRASLSLLVREIVVGASAIVCSDEAGEVSRWRALFDDAAAAGWTASDPAGAPKVLCRVNLASSARSATAAEVRHRLEVARAAGADGVVVRLAGVPRGDAEGLASALAGCFAPWRP